MKSAFLFALIVATFGFASHASASNSLCPLAMQRRMLLTDNTTNAYQDVLNSSLPSQPIQPAVNVNK